MPFAQSAHAHTHKLADRVNMERDSVCKPGWFRPGGGGGVGLKYCFMTVMPNFMLCCAVCEGDCARLRQTGGERATEWSREQCSITGGRKKKKPTKNHFLTVFRCDYGPRWKNNHVGRRLHWQTRSNKHMLSLFKNSARISNRHILLFWRFGRKRSRKSISTSGYIGQNFDV